MSAPTPRLELLSLTSEQLARAAHERVGRGAGEAPRVYRDVMQHARFTPEALGLGPAASARWRERFALTLPAVEEVGAQSHDAGGATRKAVLTAPDGHRVESVLVPMGRDRSAQCLSTQVGCVRACVFCETGRAGLLRQLDAHEIVAQVVVARAALGWRPRRLVFQGMGEPFDNLDALLPALSVLTDRRGLGYARDRLTLCTVGHVEGLHRLATLGWHRLDLSLSLHAADDALRAELLPGARWPLADIGRALLAARGRRNQTLGLHWCLLPGINDDREHARAAARFAAPLGRTLMHVIPYNPTSPAPGITLPARAPTRDEVDRFVGWLRDEGLAVRRRVTKGADVMAACGQLGGLPTTVPGTRPPVAHRTTPAGATHEADAKPARVTP